MRAGWREPGGVLLLSCYELGHQPLAVASARAFLQDAGYDPAVRDTAVESLDEEAARRARFVGISVPMHTAVRLGVKLARRVRDVNPSVHVCFFGLYAALQSNHLRSSGLADSCLGGELEGDLVDLVQRLEKTEGAGDEVATTLRRLDYRIPSRSAFPPLDRYAKLDLGHEHRLAGAVETSRGCKYGCRHCPIPAVYGNRFFAVPREVVLADVEQLVATGARHVTFADPDFLNGPRHAIETVEAMHPRFPGVTFDFTAKVEHLLGHRELLPRFAELGGLFVVSAIESFSDEVLDVLAKGHTRYEALEVLDVVRDAGMSLRPTFVPFTPWSGIEDYRELLEIVESRGLIEEVDPVQFAIRLLVPPGSLLLEEPRMTPFLGPAEPENFVVPWRHPDPGMDGLHRAVAHRVEVEKGRNATEVFERICEIVEGRFGVVVPRTAGSRVGGREAPKLTETWFC